MHYQIKNRWNDKVIYEGEAESFKALVATAVKYRAYLSDAYLAGADLSGVNLSDVNLSGADLSGANLADVNLSGANLSGANLAYADLSGANLAHAYLSRANLSRADLSRVNLSGANLADVNLAYADLSGVNLAHAYLSRANLSRANLSRANLAGVNLSGVKEDFFKVLSLAKNEIPALREKLVAGEVDGSVYSGECACLVGTIANVRGCHYQKIEGLEPDSTRPIEQLFMAIKKGSTPENNPISKIVLGWVDEFLKTESEVSV